MATKNRTALKDYFKIGRRPTEGQFADLIDSVIHRQDDVININSSNHVGIGTATPGAILDVTDQGSGVPIYRATDPAGQSRWRIDHFYNMFLTDAGGQDIIKIGQDNSWFTMGNVGVGITSPDERLHINGNLKVTNPDDYPYGINVETDIGGSWAREYSFSRNGTGKLFAFGALGDGDTLNYGYIGGNSTDSTIHSNPWMVFDPNGNIGIGTTVPQYPVHISGDGGSSNSFATLYINSTDNHGGIVMNSMLGKQSHIRFSENDVLQWQFRVANQHDSNLRLYNWGAESDVMVFQDNTGNIGIGITNPQDKLDINGVIRFNGNTDRRIYGASRSTRETVVLDGHWDELEVKGRIIDWTGSNLHIGYDNAHPNEYIEMGRNVGHIRLLSGGGDAETMRIAPNGNVGIGTDNPNATLDVNGTANISGRLSTQNGKVRRDFITWNTADTGATPIHIKTNISKNSNTMYRILVEGYAYGAQQPINSEVVGYAYQPEIEIFNGSAINHASGVSIQQYYSSGPEQFVVIKLIPTNTYYLGFSASAWFTNPAGLAFDISAQVFHQAQNL